jgi:hypothetical protein
LLVVASAAGLALAPGRAGAGQVYTVAQVNAGLARNPAAWVGRVVQVHGRAVIPIIHDTVACCSALLVDPNAPTQRIHLAWRAVSPVLAALLRIPLVKALVARRIGGIGVYRVLITRVSRVVPAPGLPKYYPYTNQTVIVSEDRAELLTDLS